MKNRRNNSTPLSSTSALTFKTLLKTPPTSPVALVRLESLSLQTNKPTGQGDVLQLLLDHLGVAQGLQQPRMIIRPAVGGVIGIRTAQTATRLKILPGQHPIMRVPVQNLNKHVADRNAGLHLHPLYVNKLDNPQLCHINHASHQAARSAGAIPC